MKAEWYADQADGVVIIHCLVHIGKASLRIDRGIEVDRLDDKELVSMLINSIDDQRAGMMTGVINHAYPSNPLHSTRTSHARLLAIPRNPDPPRSANSAFNLYAAIICD